jgi:hypothetical protein
MPRRARLARNVACLVLAGAFLATSALAQNSQPLLQIYMWRYSGSDQTPQLKALMETFRSIIQDKVDTLRSAVMSDPGGVAYLGELKINFAHQDEALSDAQAAWVADNALMILSGIVNPPAAGGPQDAVTTSVYIGDLGRPPLSPLDRAKFTVPLVVSAGEMGRIQDTHSLLTLYALTLDAVRTEQPNATIARLLAEAKNIAVNLRQAGRLQGEAKDAFDALMKIKAQLQAAP